MFKIPIKELILITADKKIEGNPKKWWWKLPNFQNIWNIKANFYNKNSQKYIKIYINKKTVLSAFHCFLFHKKIMCTSYVIALLLTPHMNYQNIFSQFFPHLAQIFNQIKLFSQKLLLFILILWKTHKTSQSSQC